MKYKFSLIALLVVSVLFSSTVAFARSSGGARATLINRTGYDIEDLYICPAGSEDWELCARRTIYDDDSVDVELPRHRHSNYFDIRCEYTNGRTDMWYSIELESSEVVVLLRNGNFNNGNGSRNSNPFKDHDDDYDDDYYKPQF